MEDKVEELDHLVKVNGKLKKRTELGSALGPHKRPNCQITGRDREYHADSTENVSSNIVEGNSPSLEQEMPTQVQKACRTPQKQEKRFCNVLKIQK